MLNALICSAAKEEQVVISLHTASYIEVAEQLLMDNYLIRHSERTTDDPNERTYVLTEKGRTYGKELLSVGAVGIFKRST